MLKYAFVALLAVSSCHSGGSKAPEPNPDSESLLGIDFKFPTNTTMSCQWIDAFKGVKYPVLSFLWLTPGMQFDCLNSFLADGRKKTILIHLSNGTCRKEVKNNCPKNEPPLERIAELALDAQQYVKSLCPDCKVLLSPQLEDNLHPNIFCKIVQQIRLNVPEAIVVRNPLFAEYSRYGEQCSDYLELHNKESAFFRDSDQKCIWSNDGYDLNIGTSVWDSPFVWSLPEWEQNSRPGCINLYWIADGNCLSTDTAKAPYPADRKCWSDPLAIKELNQLLLEAQDR